MARKPAPVSAFRLDAAPLEAAAVADLVVEVVGEPVGLVEPVGVESDEVVSVVMVVVVAVLDEVGLEVDMPVLVASGNEQSGLHWAEGRRSHGLTRSSGSRGERRRRRGASTSLGNSELLGLS